MLAARVEQKNGITKEDKNGVIPLTKKAPYKPDAAFGGVVEVGIVPRDVEIHEAVVAG